MGTLIYGSGERRIHFDDRTLAHVKSAVVTKLRRQESFTLSWQVGPNRDRGRVTIWLHPSIPLQFEFVEPNRPELNKDWLAAMVVTAAATGDVRVTPEPDLNSD